MGVPQDEVCLVVGHSNAPNRIPNTVTAPKSNPQWHSMYTVEQAHPSPARSRNALSLILPLLTMLFDHVTVQLLHPEILNDTRNHLNDYFPRPAAAAFIKRKHTEPKRQLKYVFPRDAV